MIYSLEYVPENKDEVAQEGQLMANFKSVTQRKESTPN